MSPQCLGQSGAGQRPTEGWRSSGRGLRFMVTLRGLPEPVRW